MKAGASSVWASCCGLLNEVMGAGAVHGQQPGFGAGAGPFRFAPSAAYSNYPPAASGPLGPTCTACGLEFSVFRRKHICSGCKKSFCSLCSALQENLRRCATCHLLRGTAFQRPQLMQLRVKDLRQYLLLHEVPTDTCREKEDLVDLVLCHQRALCGEEEEEEDEEEDEDDDEDEEDEEDDDDDDDDANTSSSHLQAFHVPSPRTFETSASSAPQGDPLSGNDSSGTNQQGDGGNSTSLSLINVGPGGRERQPQQASPLGRKRPHASLSDLSGEQDIEGLTVRQLKEILACNFVSYSGCCEKWELVERVGRLYREVEHNRKSMENVSDGMSAVVAYPSSLCTTGIVGGTRPQLASQDDSLCRICMDAVIDCVLLECGHMVTCTKCGKRMSECPICRQYVVRAVHVFKA
ncbi:E3 ubiquitin-protein ligase RNF34 isoform X2 [Paramormyrops kingsleyae]|uniref:E3 ubiquitin-protein ligase RNF34 isoform X2 n=1 Tax=Paramormyrops kingsleyae TaxID=1676925 RepID=UPI003B97843A